VNDPRSEESSPTHSNLNIEMNKIQAKLHTITGEEFHTPNA
jgi:hypothetical protein